MRHLLTVEDRFLIRERGLLVVPAPALDEVRGPGDIHVELHLPSGSRRSATMTLLTEFVTPAPKVRRWACVFRTLEKVDVPPGTEVWAPESIFVKSTLTTAS